MKLGRCAALAFAAMGLIASSGCSNSIWSQGHPYTESSPPGLDPRAFDTSVEVRNAQKKAWDDERDRQSARRLETYYGK